LSGTRAKATALVAVLQLIAAMSSLSAQNRGVDSLFPATPAGYVNDFAGILDPPTEAALDSLARTVESATGAQIAVVTLPTIGDREEEEVALAIGRRWGVGAKAEVGDPRRNAGVVVLLVPRKDHRPGTGAIRIEVGQGIEGIVPDAIADRIRRDVMEPDLRREAYGPALVKGIGVLASTIARGYGISDSALTQYRPVGDQGQRGVPAGSFLPILLFIVFMVLASRASGSSRRRRRIYWGGPWIGGGWGHGGGFGGGRGGGFGGFGGGGGFSGGGAGGRF
jgi:uncharacterized protein